MINIFILKKACKAKLQAKVLLGASIALDRISGRLPTKKAKLVIMGPPSGTRREVTARMFSSEKKGEIFVGILRYTLDERQPVFTAVDDCSGRAAELKGSLGGTLRDRLVKIGFWPVSRK